ncbi:hypothetical protein ABT56_11870 [Photobacterium aquae]|uniref:Uncharacterized protein n=1 Tax=Photobacterium aquae TaxID=1195763 RepID=A0A0J1H0Q9_9GAMM|nr:hypothetical protein [Photobacterium aquae]KLV05406.1 hypothetical protein ABT56_11870 [Photobacterium aquae]
MKYCSAVGLLFFVAACTSQEEGAGISSQRDIYVEDKCYTGSGVKSLTASFDEFMSERQKELALLRTELSAENYEQLEFALQHFTTYWGKLAQERDLACEQYATCSFLRLKSPELHNQSNFCDGSGFEYSVSRAKMLNFYSDIERLQLQKNAP